MPASSPVESVDSVLWKKARAGQLTRQEAARIVQAMDQFPLTVFPSRVVLEGA